MLEDPIKMHAFAMEHLTRLVGDMSDQELAAPMTPGHHSGMWILGHLNIALDFVLRRLGESVEIAQQRMDAFGPGSRPDAPLPRGMDKNSLLAELRQRQERVIAATARASRAALDRPHGLPWYEGTVIRSDYDLVCELLTTHAGFHIGQLSVYRRALGKPPLF